MHTESTATITVMLLEGTSAESIAAVTALLDGLAAEGQLYEGHTFGVTTGGCMCIQDADTPTAHDLFSRVAAIVNQNDASMVST